MANLFTDFHCHPAMKPYGKSFRTSPGENSANARSNNSIWHYDPPNLFERGLQLFTGIAKFSQADCSSLAFGNTRLVCPSLYPIERGFFRNKLGEDLVSDLANSFVTSVGKHRVDYIQGISDYFTDLEREQRYYEALHNVNVSSAGNTYQYRIVNSAAEINEYLTMQPEDVNTLLLILSIEGLHALNSDTTQDPPDLARLRQNLTTVKQWPHVPFFVTFAHHFYNHLCGHAKSLTGIVGSVVDQSEGLGTGFTETGRVILRDLLSTQNGKRIYVDIKHMSALARKEYFAMLQQECAGERIPIIVSHGAANGLRSMDEPVVDVKETGYRMLAEDINFYDNEILQVARTGGIFALQLDERRIASEQTLKHVKHSLFMNKIRHYRAALLWNQVQHIAELLDRAELFAWNCMSIGSDFDGVINPLNGFLTEETMPSLQDYLERHAFNYMNDRGSKVLHSYNQVSPSEIVNRIFTSNGLDFINKWFV